MPRKPLELPPAVGRDFVRADRAPNGNARYAAGRRSRTASTGSVSRTFGDGLVRGVSSTSGEAVQTRNRTQGVRYKKSIA
jgi:hypothetical protein